MPVDLQLASTYEALGDEFNLPRELIAARARAGLTQAEVAFVVLGGEGWKLRNFYTGGGLESYLRLSGKIRILTLESFVAKANRGEL